MLSKSLQSQVNVTFFIRHNEMIAIEVIARWIIVSPVRFPVKTESFFLERHNFFPPLFQ